MSIHLYPELSVGSLGFFWGGGEIRVPVQIEIQAISSNQLYTHFFHLIFPTLVASYRWSDLQYEERGISITPKVLFLNRIFQIPEAPL